MAVEALTRDVAIFIRFRDWLHLSDKDFDTIYTSFSILDPEYFNIISNHCISPKEMFRSLLTLENNLFSDTYLYVTGGSIVGFVNYFPISERFFRIYETNKVLFRSIDRNSYSIVKTDLKKFSALISPVNNDSDLYLQSIFVFEDSRISGVGSSLYKQFEDTAKSKDIGLSLHVRSDNITAVNFYKKLGFSVVDSCYLYLFLRKTI